MPRRTNNIPTYKRHAKSDSARCWANGKWIQLGRYNSPESPTEFARIVAEVAARQTSGRSGPDPTTTIDEVLLGFWKHAQQYYRTSDGKPTHEVNEIARSIAPLRKPYGHTPAADFGPRGLAAVQNEMIACEWCRTLINRRIDRVKRVFKWATSQELIPAPVYEAIRPLAGLQKGRTEARESDPVKPVDPAHVAATLPYLDAHLRAMVELPRLTAESRSVSDFSNMDLLTARSASAYFRSAAACSSFACAAASFCLAVLTDSAAASSRHGTSRSSM
jgi:hypothetical protein